MIAALPCIFYGGPEEDSGHLHILCERDEAVARLLCAKVEEFTTDLPLAHTAMEFMSWKQHGCRSTESLMAGAVPDELKRLFAAVWATSSRGALCGHGHVPQCWQVCVRKYNAHFLDHGALGAKQR